jgi:hypothetical protein
MESTGHSRTPSMAIDTLGYIHITWRDATDYDNSGTDYDIFYKVGLIPKSVSEIETTLTETQTIEITNTQAETTTETQTDTSTVTVTDTSTDIAETTSTYTETITDTTELTSTRTDTTVLTSEVTTLISNAKSEAYAPSLALLVITTGSIAILRRWKK